MESCEIWTNIVIGVSTGVLASIVYSALTQLRKIGACDRIQLHIEYIRTCYWQFEQELNFNHYYEAILQADNIMQSVLKIYDTLRLWTLCRRERRLFLTYCYNIFRFMERAKLEARGYDGEAELLARCARLRHYLGTEDSYIANDSSIMRNIDMMRYICENKDIVKAVSYIAKKQAPQILFQDIEATSFNYKERLTDNILRSETLTKEQYELCIKKAIEKCQLT